MKSPDALGTEDVEVLFSANAGTAPLPLTAVASGGERSRLMLALKAATGAFALAPTIVLDEIDTGVSGYVAARMAALMRGMSQHRQVLAITHLPQVASRAPHHLLVFKTADVPPVTQVVSLAGAQRVEALASMLSGSQITAASLANAEALLAEGA
jgi:DNA repair protein RecN (Recombination protein N)